MDERAPFDSKRNIQLRPIHREQYIKLCEQCIVESIHRNYTDGVDRSESVEPPKVTADAAFVSSNNSILKMAESV